MLVDSVAKRRMKNRYWIAIAAFDIFLQENLVQHV